MWDVVWVTMAAGLAGFVDAIVGGGGLILVPVMFSVFPAAAPASLFGTNKAAAVWGTAWATGQYAQRVRMNWATLLPAALVAALASLLGAWAVTVVPSGGLRKALPVILLLLLLYTLLRKDLGRAHQPMHEAAGERWRAVLVAAAIGAYDGFFGPGTGSFFVFLFVRWLGYDFLHASASAKLLNTASNLAALLLFISKGHIWWHFVLPLAAANVTGSLLGTRLALKHGSGFVRMAFIVVVSALILKTSYDAWLR